MTALIVGGLGGIGRALVARLKNEAPHLTVLQSSSDGRENTIALNLLSDDSVDAAAQHVEQLFGKDKGLRLVVNCTGMLHTESNGPERSIRDIDIEFLRQNLELHTLGWARLVKSVSPMLIKTVRQEQMKPRIQVGQKIRFWPPCRPV
mmetsp:Transcript_16934/g.19166  ORF Transcript_16934/g.19166 Transcript_16934/m.19166 type:complete len:148 (-) Transcript_16934:1530-1973(-)